MGYSVQLASKVSGAAAIAIGVLAVGSGSFWGPGTLEFLEDRTLGRAIVTLTPFLPILLIGLGAYLLVDSRRRIRE